jgi:DNA-3-methyladenine glycosylase
VTYPSASQPAKVNDAPFERSFCDRPVVDVARELLGKILNRRTTGGLLRGRIVETEAYLAAGDAACHAARGKTRKNATMFGPPGCAYVYSIHAKYCFNVVTEARGVASAVLVRAVEPLQGIDRMRHRRGRDGIAELTNGPAKLCQAFQIARTLDGWDLTRGTRLWIAEPNDGEALPFDIGQSSRIGVTSAEDLPLRFYVRDNEFVSGPKRLRS